MPSVIDSLVVTLGLDPRGYDKGRRQFDRDLDKTKDRAKKTASDIEQAGKQAAEFYRKLRIEALALFAAIVGFQGIKSFVTDMLNSSAAAGRLADTMGMSVETLSRWENAAQRVGGSAQGIDAVFQNLTSQLQQYRLTGQQGAAFPFLSMLGIRDPRELENLPQLLLKISDAIRNMPAARAMEVVRGIGGDAALFRLLRQGRPALERTLAQTPFTTKDEADKAREFLNTITELQQDVQSLGRDLVTTLAPDIEAVVKEMDAWVKANGPWLNQQVHKYIDEIATALKGLTGEEIKNGLQALKVASEVLIGLWIGEKALSMIRVINQLRIFMTDPKVMLLVNALIMLEKMRQPLSISPETVAPSSPFFHDLTPEQQAQSRKEHPSLWQRFRDWWSGPSATGDRAALTTHTQDTAMSDVQRRFLDALATGESGGDYNALNRSSGASGRYQFLASTNAEVSRQTGIYGMDPVSQDRKGWFYAAQSYKQATGRDLLADLKAGGHDAQIAAALNRRWTSLPGGAESHTTLAQWSQRLSGGGTATAQLDPSMRPKPAPRTPPAAPAQPANDDHSSDVHISQLTVHTQAKDADGIARGMQAALSRHRLVAQADYGLG